MKKSALYLLFFGFIILLLMIPGCKTTEDTVQYTLTVSVGEGVNGNPASGTYTYNANDMVNYGYSLKSGYGDLSVTLDGAPVSESGVITITGNHVLSATATKLIDIRGFWKGTMYNQDGVPFALEATFSGTLQSGSVSGFAETAGNADGTYTVSGDKIDFAIYFFTIDVWYEGTIDDENHMSGEWTSSQSPYGTWELER